MPQHTPYSTRPLRTPRRVSPLLRGARLGPRRMPSWPGGVAPTATHSPAPGLRRLRLAGLRSLHLAGLCPCLLLIHCRSSGAATHQAVVCPSVLSGCVLRLGQRRVNVLAIVHQHSLSHEVYALSIVQQHFSSHVNTNVVTLPKIIHIHNPNTFYNLFQ